jgi:hypothetical protein
MITNSTYFVTYQNSRKVPETRKESLDGIH